MEWIQMSKDDFVAKMVTLGVRYRPGFFPAGSWQQEGSVLSAYVEGVLVGQYDEATGKGCSVHQPPPFTITPSFVLNLQHLFHFIRQFSGCERFRHIAIKP